MGFLSFAVVAVVGGAATMLCPPLAAPVAHMLGVSATGIGAGTMVASAQAYVGNLAAGSVISMLQAAAMAPILP